MWHFFGFEEQKRLIFIKTIVMRVGYLQCVQKRSGGGDGDGFSSAPGCGPFVLSFGLHLELFKGLFNIQNVIQIIIIPPLGLWNSIGTDPAIEHTHLNDRTVICLYN